MAEHLYEYVLTRMDGTLVHLSSAVAPPKKVAFHDSFVYRYAEKNINQAIIQKLARCISTLRAAQLLMEHGYVHEQAALQRVLDEIEEDITFLAFGVLQNDITDLHQKYLDAFYEEEFDPCTGKPAEQDRPTIPRRKIRAYLARTHGGDPHGGSQVMRTISKTYSGYVHAASPQTMDLYIGNPPRFHTSGVFGTYRHDEHREDFWNCFYRGILSFAIVAKAFGDDALSANIRDFGKKFALANGHDYRPVSNPGK